MMKFLVAVTRDVSKKSRRNYVAAVRIGSAIVGDEWKNCRQRRWEASELIEVRRYARKLSKELQLVLWAGSEVEWITRCRELIEAIACVAANERLLAIKMQVPRMSV
ncbi:hypothetical protein C5167_036681 [Papaver somniferum]|uniref:Uncharacterized protein n=1 Tax=Papaver somniferum TaxID=3469 RepID=A0A4Y7I8J1_PAPSO|nr:hypothetical protein C5167_036681 [Papaver somniferum]